MPTRSERQALGFFAIVTALGVAVRLLRSDPPPVPTVQERLALASHVAATDSAAEAAAARKRGSAGKGRSARRPSAGPAAPASASPRGPYGAGAAAGAEAGGAATPPNPSSPRPRPAPSPATPLDLDQASAAELDRLPWIGPALAARIVAERAEHGPFGSAEGLERVRGIGPKLAERLRPLVTFSGAARPRNAAPGGAVSRAGERLWAPAGDSPRP